MTPIISVIIPVYNRQESVGRCLDSILGQTLGDVEIVVVDDGSTDATPEVCARYSSLDTRVRVIRTQNGGVSAARNVGLQHATGAFLRFVDSDDWLEVASLERALSRHQSDHSDIVLGGYTLHGGASGQSDLVSGYRDAALPIHEFLLLLSQARSNQIVNSCCMCSFRRDIVTHHELRFPEDVSMGEDQIFTLSYLKHASSVSLMNDFGYTYSRETPNSLSRVYHPNIYASERKMLSAALALFDQTSGLSPQNVERAYAKRLATAISTHYIRHERDAKSLRRILSAMRSDEVYLRYSDRKSVV